MTQKAFRLDFVIAIAALLVSAVSALAIIYQTHVVGQQYAATIWPYISINSSYGVHGTSIQVENDGLGPALIESAQLLIDDKPVPSWGPYLNGFLTNPALPRTPGGRSISATSFGRSTTIRPGESMSLFSIVYKTQIDPRALTAHAVGIRLCYCSINNSCWSLIATPGKDSTHVPQLVSGCTDNASISSDLSYPTAAH
ncbi:MAG TPA: hypothetical protein VF741_08645 [Candidatus Aquilonibacter sp.]